jgi:hypothetical protein
LNRTTSFVLILRASTVPDDAHVIPMAPDWVGELEFRLALLEQNRVIDCQFSNLAVSTR